ncbi:hypothetical protein C8K44_10828 [Aminobacter sp. AP02]|nr:hypothetical protein C8K44_10828 [Aminobacter sp. AP02]
MSELAPINSHQAQTPSSLPARFGMIGTAIVALLCLVTYDAVVHDRDLLEKDRVDWTMFGLVRPVVTFVAACLPVLGLRPHPSNARPLENQSGLLAVVYVMGGLLLLAAASVVLAPQVLFDTVREGGPVSNLTELVFLIALAGLGAAGWRARRERARVFGLPVPVIFAGMFVVTFLILMEEMSWGQHWIGWSAGPMFEGNAQDETNLHNFATYKFEAAYYSAAFLFFVALPAFWPARVGGWWKQVESFVPPKLLALASLPLTGFLYEEWNVVPYQVWFFMGLLIAILLAAELRHERPAPRVAGLMMAILLPVSQLVFVFGGHRMLDGYELSEIRELLIPGIIAAYGWWLFTSRGDAGWLAR